MKLSISAIELPLCFFLFLPYFLNKSSNVKSVSQNPIVQTLCTIGRPRTQRVNQFDQINFQMLGFPTSGHFYFDSRLQGVSKLGLGLKRF